MNLPEKAKDVSGCLTVIAEDGRVFVFCNRNGLRIRQSTPEEVKLLDTNSLIEVKKIAAPVNA